VRLLWVGRDRTKDSFEKFFTLIGEQLAGKIEFVCPDMWHPYLDVIAKHCPQALNILDRFHMVTKLNKALDEVRAGEARRMESHTEKSVRLSNLQDRRALSVSRAWQACGAKTRPQILLTKRNWKELPCTDRVGDRRYRPSPGGPALAAGAMVLVSVGASAVATAGCGRQTCVKHHAWATSPVHRTARSRLR